MTKIFFIRFQWQFFFIVSERNGYANFEEISDDYFEFMTEDKNPLYSNTSDDCSIPKNLKKIEQIVGYNIFNNFDLNRKFVGNDMVQVFDCA